MAEMDSIVSDAEAFVRRARVVTLDSLLSEAEAVAKEFAQFEASVQSMKGYWIKLNCWDIMSKPELIELARERKCSFRASDSKRDLLNIVVNSFWEELDACAAFTRAFDEDERIRRWAKRLSEVPERLQELVDDAETYYRVDWTPKHTTIHDAASTIRSYALGLLEFEWASSKAKHALRDVREGRPLADVVYWLTREVNMAIMGIIPSNLSVSGVGLDHMAVVGGSKKLTRAFYRAVPEEARQFISTVYH